MPTRDEIQEFSHKIITIAEGEGLSHMDAIIQHCEDTGMEIEVASTLISTALKAKIREEAQELNLLKRNAKLPI